MAHNTKLVVGGYLLVALTLWCVWNIWITPRLYLQKVMSVECPLEIVNKSINKDMTKTRDAKYVKETVQELIEKVPERDLRICENWERLDNIKKVCQSNPYYGPGSLDNIMVIDKYKLIACIVPKAGSTTMKTFFARSVLRSTDYKFSAHELYMNDTGFRNFKMIDEHERMRLLKDYYKVAFIRHPLDRFRSAYNDKIMNHNTEGNNIRIHYQKIIQDYMVNTGKFSEQTFNLHEDILEMEDFFHIIGNNLTGFKNIHWRSLGDICQPCNIAYDLIVKLETVDRDMEILTKYIKSVDKSAFIPQQIHVHKNFATRQAVNKLDLVSELVQKFNQTSLQSLVNHVSGDFTWAGYGWTSKSGATCETGEYGCC